MRKENRLGVQRIRRGRGYTPAELRRLRSLPKKPYADRKNADKTRPDPRGLYIATSINPGLIARYTAAAGRNGAPLALQLQWAADIYRKPRVLRLNHNARRMFGLTAYAQRTALESCRQAGLLEYDRDGPAWAVRPLPVRAGKLFIAGRIEMPWVHRMLDVGGGSALHLGLMLAWASSMAGGKTTSLLINHRLRTIIGLTRSTYMKYAARMEQAGYIRRTLETGNKRLVDLLDVGVVWPGNPWKPDDKQPNLV